MTLDIKMTVLAIYSGKITQAYGIETAIDKQLVSGDIEIDEYGIVTDECADPKHHGGTERALHHYPQEHYSLWKTQYQALDINRDWLPSSMARIFQRSDLTNTMSVSAINFSGEKSLSK